MNKEEIMKEMEALKAKFDEMNALWQKIGVTLQLSLALQKANQKEILNVTECAELIGISEDSINYYVQNELIPFKKIGKHTRFSKPFILKWIEEDMSDIIQGFKRRNSNGSSIKS
jgi:hypothetical protein